MLAIDKAIFEKAEGGFWISETGEPIPVEEMCGHSIVSEKMWGTSYYGSYAAGRIRISTCDGGDATAYVSLGMASVTFEALKSLSSILRHEAFPKSQVQIEDEYIAWGATERSHNFFDDKGASRAASWAMKEAMIKRLAQRNVTPQEVLHAA